MRPISLQKQGWGEESAFHKTKEEMTNKRGHLYERLESKYRKLYVDRMQWDESVQGFMMSTRRTNHLNNCVLNRL